MCRHNFMPLTRVSNTGVKTYLWEKKNLKNQTPFPVLTTYDAVRLRTTSPGLLRSMSAIATTPRFHKFPFPAVVRRKWSVPGEEGYEPPQPFEPPYIDSHTETQKTPSTSQKQHHTKLLSPRASGSFIPSVSVSWCVTRNLRVHNLINGPGPNPGAGNRKPRSCVKWLWRWPLFSSRSIRWCTLWRITERVGRIGPESVVRFLCQREVIQSGQFERLRTTSVLWTWRSFPFGRAKQWLIFIWDRDGGDNAGCERSEYKTFDVHFVYTGGNIYNFDFLRRRFRSIAVTLTPENKRCEWKRTFVCSYIPRS